MAHGTTKAIKQIALCIWIIAFILGWLLCGELTRKRENYQQLHQRVSKLEANCVK